MNFFFVSNSPVFKLNQCINGNQNVVSGNKKCYWKGLKKKVIDVLRSLNKRCLEFECIRNSKLSKIAEWVSLVVEMQEQDRD